MTLKTHWFRFLLLPLLVLGANAEQSLKLSGLIRDNMVLQRETEAPIWGWAEAGEKVEVTGSWDKKSIAALADADGKWTAILKTPKAGGPFEIRVKGVAKEIDLKNVLSGEVWICGGQSNMQWKMRGFGLEQFADDVKKADYPEIRLCTLPQILALEPQDDTNAPWQVCNPQTVLNFSAVGYFFGSQLHQELGVPIGLISSNMGGSAAEAWISEGTLREKFPIFSGTLDTYATKAGKSGAVVKRGAPEFKGFGNQSPALLYNGMIAPLAPFAMKGVIWYQGESNVKEPMQYRSLFPAVIEEWRSQWKQGDFPFYFVQIAPFLYKGNPYPAALLREAQTMALSVPETGMAVTMDIGEANNIHPKEKKPVGERLARLALARTYGQSELVDSGPMFREFKVEGDKIRLGFDHVGGGLTTNDEKPLTHFTIAGDDKVFHPADATFDRDTILVSSAKVRDPKAVRFGWGNTDDTNFVNEEGLPSPSFRTDDWPIEPAH
ncbi:MAG: sialate O-acetylesterase [Luteolibacter sp.]